MIEFLVTWITSLISAIGYPGVYLLMVLESMVMPVPSEAVMPFAGYLAAVGRFDFWLIVLFATLGSITGSIIGYAMGFYGGYPVVRKIGKYLFLNDSHLKWTENFFRRRGSITIFICRFIPVVRHLISIPAGVAKMDLKKFILFTIIGAAMWNTFLLYLGYRLAARWDLITHYSRYLDILVALVVVAYLFFHFWHRRKNRRA